MTIPLNRDQQLDIELLRERLHALRHAVQEMGQPLDGSLAAEQAQPEREELYRLLSEIDELLERSIPAEQALREREERYRLLVEEVQDYAIFMLDVTGHIMSWNAGAQRIKGYSADEIIGRHFSIFYPPEDIAAGKPGRELEIAVAEGRLEDEGWRVRKDGTRFWANVVITALFDEAGKLRGFGKVTRDMTERRAAELAIVEGRRLPEEHAAAVRQLDEAVAGTISRLRNLVFRLRPPGIDREGLAEVLSSYLVRWSPGGARSIRSGTTWSASRRPRRPPPSSGSARKP